MLGSLWGKAFACISGGCNISGRQGVQPDSNFDKYVIMIREKPEGWIPNINSGSLYLSIFKDWHFPSFLQSNDYFCNPADQGIRFVPPVISCYSENLSPRIRQLQGGCPPARDLNYVESQCKAEGRGGHAGTRSQRFRRRGVGVLGGAAEPASRSSFPGRPRLLHTLPSSAGEGCAVTPVFLLAHLNSVRSCFQRKNTHVRRAQRTLRGV